MSSFLSTANAYAKRYGLSGGDRLGLLARYPVFRALHEASHGRGRSRAIAQSVVPLFAGLRFVHRIQGTRATAALSLCLRGDDVDSFSEIFFGDEYGGVSAGEARTYVDAGANVGMAAAYFAVHLPLERALLIEANPALAPRLQASVDGLPSAVDVAVEQAALASVSGPLSFTVSENHRMSGIDQAVGDRITIRARTLRELLDAHGFETVDLLKMDIEGAEHDVILHDVELFDRVGVVVMELHGERADRETTARALGRRGFHLDHRRAPEADILVATQRGEPSPD